MCLIKLIVIIHNLEYLATSYVLACKECRVLFSAFTPDCGMDLTTTHPVDKGLKDKVYFQMLNFMKLYFYPGPNKTVTNCFTGFFFVFFFVSDNLNSNTACFICL